MLHDRGTAIGASADASKVSWSDRQLRCAPSPVASGSSVLLESCLAREVGRWRWKLLVAGAAWRRGLVSRRDMARKREPAQLVARPSLSFAPLSWPSKQRRARAGCIASADERPQLSPSTVSAPDRGQKDPGRARRVLGRAGRRAQSAWAAFPWPLCSVLVACLKPRCANNHTRCIGGAGWMAVGQTKR